MKYFWIILCILFLGVGLLLGRWSNSFRENRRHAGLRNSAMTSEQIAQIKVYIATRTNRYPIPPSVDFSTNTIRQMVFWQTFCSTYDYWKDKRYREAIRTPGINFEDPRWFQFVDSHRGWEFAEWLFHCRDIQGSLGTEDIPQWVATNYLGFYDENYYKRFNIKPPIWYEKDEAPTTP